MAGTVIQKSASVPSEMSLQRPAVHIGAPVGNLPTVREKI